MYPVLLVMTGMALIWLAVWMASRVANRFIVTDRMVADFSGDVATWLHSKDQ